MIEGGLGYGLLTTGAAIVFLKVDWDEPETLYYHLAEPGPENSVHPNNSHLCTAVGRTHLGSTFGLPTASHHNTLSLERAMFVVKINDLAGSEHYRNSTRSLRW